MNVDKRRAKLRAEQKIDGQRLIETYRQIKLILNINISKKNATGSGKFANTATTLV